jgi:ABC-2 type transport system ATP-binding protein
MLSASNISKRYKRQTVLDGVAFEARSGEIIGVAGENGCGKSTLLNILTGVAQSDSGSVTLEGVDITKEPKTLRALLGYVPQENALFDQLNAGDNLRLWASAYGADWKAALPFLFPEGEGFTEKDEVAFLRKKPPQLSGGMRKRLSIALSLVHNPRYVIMDEPTAGLDIGFSRKLAETMKLMRSRGQCVVFTSHHTDELLLCDRLYVLRGGKFAYEGSPAELIKGGDTGESADRLYHVMAGRRDMGKQEASVY